MYCNFIIVLRANRKSHLPCPREKLRASTVETASIASARRLSRYRRFEPSCVERRICRRRLFPAATGRSSGHNQCTGERRGQAIIRAGVACPQFVKFLVLSGIYPYYPIPLGCASFRPHECVHRKSSSFCKESVSVMARCMHSRTLCIS
jgi:hypothetical protein